MSKDTHDLFLGVLGSVIAGAIIFYFFKEKKPTENPSYDLRSAYEIKQSRSLI